MKYKIFKKRDLKNGEEPRPSEILQAIYEFSNEIQYQLSEIKGGLGEVRQDVDLIKMRLDHVAYRFELKELSGRVDRLEGLGAK